MTPQELEEQATAILLADREERGLYAQKVITGDEYSWLSPQQLRTRQYREIPVNGFHSYDGASITLAPTDSMRTKSVSQVWGRGDFNAPRPDSVDLSKVCDMYRCEEVTQARGLCIKHYSRRQARTHLCCEFSHDNVWCAGDRFSMWNGIYLCRRHYTRAKRYGDPTVVKKTQKGKGKYRLCSMPDCEKEHEARGLCHTHYHKHHRKQQQEAA